MQGFFKFIIAIIGLLNFYSNIFAKDEEALSHKDIMESIVAMNLHHAQGFCKKINDACYLVDQNLTNTPKNNLNFKTSTLLEIFSSSSDYKELREFHLCSIEDQSLTLGKYLEFAMAMTPKKKRGSYSHLSYDTNSINKFQQDLQISFSKWANNSRWIEQITEALNNPLEISPYNLYCFRGAFKKLLKNSPPQPHNSFINGEITHRNIADKFANMNFKEISQFSQKVCEAGLRVQKFLRPYSHLNYNSYRGDVLWRNINQAKKIIQAFQSFHEDLHNLRNFKIWQFDGRILNLESYLQFFVDMHPQLQYEEGFLFVKREKYANEMQILSYFGLNLNSQYALIVR